MKRLYATALRLGLFVLLAMTFAGAGDSGYHLLNTYNLGGDGGWDYLTVSRTPPGGSTSRALPT